MEKDSCQSTRIGMGMPFGLLPNLIAHVPPYFYHPTTNVLGVMKKIRIRDIPMKPFGEFYRYAPKETVSSVPGHAESRKYVRTIDPNVAQQDGRIFGSMGSVRANRVFDIQNPDDLFWCSSTELQDLSAHEMMEAQLLYDSTIAKR